LVAEIRTSLKKKFAGILEKGLCPFSMGRWASHTIAPGRFHGSAGLDRSRAWDRKIKKLGETGEKNSKKPETFL